MKQVAETVFYADAPIVRVSAADLATIRDAALRSARKRARLCAHIDPQDRLHEMLIVLVAGGYIRPHRHLGRAESFHVMEGSADVVVFDDAGQINDVIEMGPLGSDRIPFYRMNQASFHTVVVRSPYFTVHETTTGPLDPTTTEFAPWAPAEDDSRAAEYADALNHRLAQRSN